MGAAPGLERGAGTAAPAATVGVPSSADAQNRFPRGDAAVVPHPAL